MMHLPLAYIGPGAGFALAGSFLALLLSLLASALSFLLWPFRMLWAAVRRGRGMRAARVRRVILLGVDGLDPNLTEELLSEGKLPNLARLREQGSYQRLRPAEWSSLATGSGAGGEPFWKILGRHSVSSTILQMPGSFAGDEFDGRMLAAHISAPRGGYSWFTTEAPRADGGRFELKESEGSLEGTLAGSVKFRITDPRTDPHLEIEGETYVLKPHAFTPWVYVTCGGVRGIVRFLATGTGEEFSLYASAMQPDPEQPEQPISYPPRYAAYLARLHGPFATQAAGDEAALHAGAIEAEDFLMQVKLAQDERESIFFSALEHQPAGVVACMFDTPSCIERVFRDHGEVTRWTYREMDRVVARTLERAHGDTAVFVLSANVLFSNRKTDAEDPGCEDIAPTVLRLFGVAPPEWMKGKPVIHFA
jgi:hypothetical protein